jgi:hypothetical protein
MCLHPFTDRICAVRRSHDKTNGKSAIHMVSAWTSDTNMVLGQLKTDEKSNEITAIPELLDLLDISGRMSVESESVMQLKTLHWYATLPQTC